MIPTSVRGETASRVERRSAKRLRVQLFADGADRDTMLRLHAEGAVDGFTTNPTLMRKAGVTDYETFAYEVLREITDVPISFEVFADDFGTMERQARKIASWGSNVIVKIPIMNTAGESSIPLVRRLTTDGLSLNVTAMMTADQARTVVDVVPRGVGTILSVFAGRVADTGVDPVPVMRDVVGLCRGRPELRVLWASPREVFNVYQAEECGCHIITATPDLLEKMSLRDKDLAEFSRDTVKMFYEDARRAGYQL